MIPKNDKKIIMIHSYKGGTGKSALAINISYFLAEKMKKKVLLIEQDTGGSSFSDNFNLKPKKSWNDFYNKGFSLKDLIVKMDLFDIICAKPGDFEIPIGEESKLFFSRQLERFMLQKKWLKANYDVIILDTHPGFSFELLNSILIADIAILVIRLDFDTINNTIMMYNKIYAEFKEKKIILVQNQVPSPMKDYSVSFSNPNYAKINRKWNDFVKNKKLVTIPLKNDIAYALSKNKLVDLDNPFMEYVETIINHL